MRAWSLLACWLLLLPGASIPTAASDEQGFAEARVQPAHRLVRLDVVPPEQMVVEYLHDALWIGTASGEVWRFDDGGRGTLVAPTGEHGRGPITSLSGSNDGLLALAGGTRLIRLAGVIEEHLGGPHHGIAATRRGLVLIDDERDVLVLRRSRAQAETIPWTPTWTDVGRRDGSREEEPPIGRSGSTLWTSGYLTSLDQSRFAYVENVPYAVWLFDVEERTTRPILIDQGSQPEDLGQAPTPAFQWLTKTTIARLIDRDTLLVDRVVRRQEEPHPETGSIRHWTESYLDLIDLSTGRVARRVKVDDVAPRGARLRGTRGSDGLVFTDLDEQKNMYLVFASRASVLSSLGVREDR